MIQVSLKLYRMVILHRLKSSIAILLFRSFGNFRNFGSFRSFRRFKVLEFLKV